MAVHYRKLGRTSSQRKALLRNQVTALINNGRITTTEAKAEEIQRIAERLIALAVTEKDNFETVKVTAKVARKDKDGKRVKQIVDKEIGKVLSEKTRDENGKALKIEIGVTVTVYDEVEKEIKKELEKTNNVDAAAYIGQVIAKRAIDKGIKTVVFDRGGFIYQGKVKALADAAREAGLEF